MAVEVSDTVNVAPGPDDAAPDQTQEAPANMAVWVLIWAELTEFALFFIVFLIVRAHEPELFANGPTLLNTTAGVLNTLLLLTSSYFVARAMAAIRINRIKTSIRWMMGTIACGVGYCLVKLWEYQWNHDQGLSSRTDLFYTLYYYLTFNHLLHVLVGMVAIGWACLRCHWGHFTPEHHEGYEGAAFYWHMIDLVWIIIFPLLYVMR